MNCLAIKNSIVKIFLELFIPNRCKRSILKAKWTKFCIKKYAKKSLKKIEEFKTLEEKESKIIWQYWHQGEENSPDIIKKCLNSIKKNYPDYQVNVLDFNSIKKYIELPEKFYTLLEKKRVPIAIFSDILRLNLLAKYGGIWIDSTMYATSRLPEEILNSSFFVFQKEQKYDPMQNCMSCYFIKANANNYWINIIKTALEEYWQDNNYLINYFLFEHMVTILANKLPEEWQKIPYYRAGDTCEMQFKLFEKYNKDDFNETLNKTSIHKLTYKNFPKQINKETNCAKLLQL